MRVSVGWDEVEVSVNALLENSYIHFSIKESDRLIAFARVVSDGTIYAFIVDVIVHPDYQNHGVGSMLIDCVISELKKDGVKMIQVVFETEPTSFYGKCGFEILSAGSIVNLETR